MPPISCATLGLNVTFEKQLLKAFNQYTGKRKGKVHPRTDHEGPEMEQRYRSILSLTSALDGVGDKRHVSTVLTPRKTRYPLYRRLGGPQGRSGRVRKMMTAAHSESLCRLSCPCSIIHWMASIIITHICHFYYYYYYYYY